MATVSRGMGPTGGGGITTAGGYGGVSAVRSVQVNRDELGWVSHGSLEVGRAGTKTACREGETLSRVRVSTREPVDRLEKREAGNGLERERGRGCGAREGRGDANLETT
jgi:hypothetical protein